MFRICRTSKSMAQKNAFDYASSEGMLSTLCTCVWIGINSKPAIIDQLSLSTNAKRR